MTSTLAITDSQRSKILKTLLLTVFIDLLGVTIVIPIVAPLFLDLKKGVLPFDFSTLTPATMQQGVKDAIHYRTIIYALLVASFPLAQFIGAPYLGALADKVGRKKVLTYSIIGSGIGYFLFAIGIYYRSIELLFISRILDGFTGGNIAIAFSAVADISKPEEKPKNFGLLGAAFGVGFIIGPYIGGKLADSSILSWFSFEVPYIVSGLLCVLNLFMVIKFFIETYQPVSTTKPNIWQGFINLKKAFSTTSGRYLFSIVFFVTFGFTMFTTFYQVFLIDKFKFTQSNVGDYFAFIGLFIAFTQGFLGRKLTSINPNTIITYTSLGLAMAFILVVLPNSVWLLYVLSPLIALCQGLLSPNLQTMVSNSVNESRQGEISGINQSVQSIAQAIPPILSAFLVNINRNFSLYGAAFFTFVAAVIFLFKIRKK
jgi:MFS transporter, DHA1 family, tetracycline resistance protein